MKHCSSLNANLLVPSTDVAVLLWVHLCDMCVRGATFRCRDRFSRLSWREKKMAKEQTTTMKAPKINPMSAICLHSFRMNTYHQNLSTDRIHELDTWLQYLVQGSKSWFSYIIPLLGSPHLKTLVKPSLKLPPVLCFSRSPSVSQKELNSIQSLFCF